MAAFLPFLRARLAERSSRIQLLVLVMLALVLGGVVTLDQINAYSAKIMAALAVLGPLAGMLVPDKNHDVTGAASVDEAVGVAVDMATAAAEKAAGPQATAVAQTVDRVMDKLGL